MTFCRTAAFLILMAVVPTALAEDRRYSGMKQGLAGSGIAITGAVTQFLHGFVVGDGINDWQYGGKADFHVALDGRKLRLWNGLSANILAEYQFGEDANDLGDGSIIAVNTALAFPRLGERDHSISFNMTQSFGSNFSISAGKFNMLDAASRSPLVGGGGLDTFINMGIAAPISGVTPPYLLGAIASYRSTPLIVTGMIYDPRNAQDKEVLVSPFDDGVTYSLSLTKPISTSGLMGFYGLRGVYSTQEGLDFGAIPGLIFSGINGTDVEGNISKKGYWYVSASAQQYLWVDQLDPRRGWGVFAELGLSDGNPNAVLWHAFGGLAGNSPITGREDDLWGVGYFVYTFSPELIDALSLLNIDIEREKGIEAFYNFAFSESVRLSANVQWLDPGNARKRNSIGLAFRLKHAY